MTRSPRHFLTRRVALLLLAGAAVGTGSIAASGCATVEPWERGTLAAERMQLDVDPDENAMVGSRRRSREEGVVGTSGAGGASAASGGGCGCH